MEDSHWDLFGDIDNGFDFSDVENGDDTGDDTGDDARDEGVDTVNDTGDDKYYDARDDENVLFGSSDSSSGDSIDGEDSCIHEMKKVMAEKYHEVKVKAGEACVEQLKKEVNAAVAEVKGREISNNLLLNCAS